jgi:hypothetical protein
VARRRRVGRQDPRGLYLLATGKHLLQGGLALVTLDIDSDTYLLMVLPVDRVKESQRLAESARYGFIAQW